MPPARAVVDHDVRPGCGEFAATLRVLGESDRPHPRAVRSLDVRDGVADKDRSASFCVDLRECEEEGPGLWLHVAGAPVWSPDDHVDVRRELMNVDVALDRHRGVVADDRDRSSRGSDRADRLMGTVRRAGALHRARSSAASSVASASSSSVG